MSELIYLYGFVPAGASAPANTSGVGGGAVEVVDVGAVAAAVSRVSAQDYDPQRIEAHLQDLSWVAEQGVAHETVVAWFVDHSEILPVPLFTLYSGIAAMQKEIAPKVAEISAELARLANKREWDVKISFNEADLERHASALSPRLAELEQEANAASPGKRYLLQKKRADLLKAETRKAAHDIAGDVLQQTAAVAIERRSLPIPRTADELPVIAYAALLVERDRESDLIDILERQATHLQSLGMALAFSGPWAPYRFTGEHERTAAG